MHLDNTSIYPCKFCLEPMRWDGPKEKRVPVDLNGKPHICKKKGSSTSLIKKEDLSKRMEYMIVFDTETTGLDSRTDKIIQIGMVALKLDTLSVENTLNLYIKFNEDKVSKKALEINKYEERKDKWANAITEPEAIQKILDFIAPYYFGIPNKAGTRLYPGIILGGHNVKFDCNFLDAMFTNNGHKPLLYKVQDTMHFVLTLEILKVKDFEMHHSLGKVLEVFGGQSDNLHDALEDALKTTEIFQNIFLILFNFKATSEQKTPKTKRKKNENRS